MQFKRDVVVVALGSWGPFEDGRTIDYYDLADPSGEGSLVRATRAREAQFSVQPMTKGEATIELVPDQQKPQSIKLRMHDFKPSARAAQAA